MFRRIFLVLAVLGAAACASGGSSAEARGCYRGSYYGGHSSYYRSARYHHSYGPSYYRSGPSHYYGGHHGYHGYRGRHGYHGGSGISFSIGF